MRDFSIKDYISNEQTPVVTRDGRKARVLATDVDVAMPVAVAVINKAGWTEVFQMHGDGRYIYTIESELDLFFA